MIDFVINKMHDARFMTMLLAAVAASATAYTLIMPLFAGEGLAKRMKAVANERERLRQRERERLNKNEKVSLRQSPKQLVSKVVEDFNLTKWLAQEAARDKLVMAGYRGQAPYITFLFARLVTPIVMFIGAILYVFVISQMQKSVALSEEFTLTTAELSYLQDRKVAYENLARRTGLEGVKSVCLALQQSERYGTPLGQSLRVMAQENRDMRMNEAEKKAAALPPKLTVPMILFFLPVLFIVILGPTYIKITHMQ